MNLAGILQPTGHVGRPTSTPPQAGSERHVKAPPDGRNCGALHGVDGQLFAQIAREVIFVGFSTCAVLLLARIFPEIIQ